MKDRKLVLFPGLLDPVLFMQAAHVTPISLLARDSDLEDSDETIFLK